MKTLNKNTSYQTLLEQLIKNSFLKESTRMSHKSQNHFYNRTVTVSRSADGSLKRVRRYPRQCSTPRSLTRDLSKPPPRPRDEQPQRDARECTLPSKYSPLLRVKFIGTTTLSPFHAESGFLVIFAGRRNPISSLLKTLSLPRTLFRSESRDLRAKVSE